jgi:hypothetical protein
MLNFMLNNLILNRELRITNYELRIIFHPSILATNTCGVANHFFLSPIPYFLFPPVPCSLFPVPYPKIEEKSKNIFIGRSRFKTVPIEW